MYTPPPKLRNLIATDFNWPSGSAFACWICIWKILPFLMNLVPVTTMPWFVSAAAGSRDQYRSLVGNTSSHWREPNKNLDLIKVHYFNINKCAPRCYWLVHLVTLADGAEGRGGQRKKFIMVRQFKAGTIKEKSIYKKDHFKKSVPYKMCFGWVLPLQRQ